mmetsp:Transcript_9851/g.36740  ORF Transcript_9851/g.36740 Transcript_9851/m.36740 type:complete len:106 (+) Transcript_9851:2421-2738(+)
MPSNAKLNKENQQANSVAQSGKHVDASVGAVAQGKEEHGKKSVTGALQGVKQRFSNLSKNASKAMNDSKKRHDRKGHQKDAEKLYAEKNVDGLNNLLDHPEKFEK